MNRQIDRQIDRQIYFNELKKIDMSKNRQKRKAINEQIYRQIDRQIDRS